MEGVGLLTALGCNRFQLPRVAITTPAPPGGGSRRVGQHAHAPVVAAAAAAAAATAAAATATATAAAGGAVATGKQRVKSTHLTRTVNA